MKTPHHREMIKLIEGFRYKFGVWDVFSDFVEFGAIATSNKFDLWQFETREARYFEMIKKYTREELSVFAELLAHLRMALDIAGPEDVLGSVFHELDVANKHMGQFFTPPDISTLLGLLVANGQELAEKIDARGFVTLCEPAVGGGATVLGFAAAMAHQGFDYRTQLHATGVDIDIKCVHMSYLQLSFLGIPAVIVHGNSLTLEERSVWRTPAHIMGGWELRLRGEPVPEFAEPSLDTLPVLEGDQAVLLQI